MDRWRVLVMVGRMGPGNKRMKEGEELRVKGEAWYVALV